MKKLEPIQIEILDTTTGEKCKFHDDDTVDDEFVVLYLWEEGNYSCDCNRALFFAKALRMPQGALNDVPCGTSRFLVRISREGDVLYDEFPKATGETTDDLP